jgi:hypothetical protein
MTEQEGWYGDEYTKPAPIPPSDTAAAIHFLKRWRPEGPWVLTSIVPDGKTTTQTFTVEKWHDASAWIEERQAVENIYFHVNPTLGPLSNKASKEHMARLSWLHVDLDPRAGEDFTAERERALNLLRKYPKHPTVIVDSGGGFQGFWQLLPSEMLETYGKVDKAQELERYNIQLELEFGADHCHNIDRIMRLPGTINLPNLRKRKKGRKPALAILVEWNDATVYPIEAFVPAPRVQQTLPEAGLPNGHSRVVVPGNVPVVGTEELRDWASKAQRPISDHCLALIATGQDPNDPLKYQSRSEALFKVCCDLVRAEVPDEMIYAVITGPNEIASSVLDKPNWEQYALRQIERAKEEVIDPVLRQLNEKHAVIADVGGKCRIISEVDDPGLGRTRISTQTFEDFRNRYRHIKVTLGVGEGGIPITKSAGAFWIDHELRRQYETIIFAPGKETTQAYNLWRGFACDSLPGDRHQPFLLHLRDNLCGGNPEHYVYLIQWMARCVQHPDGPGEVALVLRGKRGTGKSFFAKQFGRLWGRHFIQISDSKHLVGSFNAHLRDAVLVFGDEAFFAGDRRHESVLKTLVTEESIVIEGKGIDAVAAPNYTHLILASNDAWVVPAGLDERRFFVLEVSEEHKQDFGYFQGIKQNLDDGGLENLLHFLMTRDLGEYNVRKVPQTGALMEQKILSMDPETEWMYEMLWEGRLLKKDSEWREKIVAEEWYAEYIARMDVQRRPYRMNPTAFGKFISHCMPKGHPRKVREMCDVPWLNQETGFMQTLKKRSYVYYLPALEICRAHWDQFFGGPYDWPKAEPLPLDTSKVAATPF